MLPIARDGFTKKQITDALHGVYQSPVFRFRYELLDGDDNVKGELTTVVDAEISVKSLANIHRTMRLNMKDDGNVDYLHDKIAPYVLLWIPPQMSVTETNTFLAPYHNIEGRNAKNKQPGGWAEFPLGVFHLSAPNRTDKDGGVYRDITCYDGLIVLQDDKFIDRYSITAGTLYYDAIKNILNSAGITKINLEYTDKTLNDAKEFEPGTKKLTAINSLLRSINYDAIKVDVHGYYTSKKYQLPSQRAAEYTYSDNDASITLPGVEEEFPIDSVPNQFVAIRSNEEDAPLYSTYTNDNPDSPVSTVNRGRTITRRDEVQDIADQEALDGYVQRVAHEATKLYGKVKFKSGMLPFHDIDDTIQFNYSRLGITEKYTETAWHMKLQAGAEMEHEVRRVVHI